MFTAIYQIFTCALNLQPLQPWVLPSLAWFLLVMLHLNTAVMTPILLQSRNWIRK